MPSALAEPAPAALAAWPRIRLRVGRLAGWYLPFVYRLRPRLVPGNQVRLRRDWTVEIGEGLEEPEVVALVIELCDHLERDHLGRRGERDPAAWAQAASCESIGAWEEVLAGEPGRLDGGFRARFPRGSPSPRRYGLAPSLRAEEYYSYFADGVDEALALFGPYGPPTGTIRPHEAEPGQGLAGPGRRFDGPGEGEGEQRPEGALDGGGAGGQAGEGISGGSARPDAGVSPETGEEAAGFDLAGSEAPEGGELQAVVRQVESEMRRAAPGTLPGDLERRVRRGARPEVAWRRELADALGRQAGRHDYSVLPRPNYARLVATGALGSRLQVGLPRVTVVRDSSASMDEGLLRQALAELEELARHGPELLVVDADTRVQRIRHLGVDLERITGGGGTDMVAAAWEAWRRTRPDWLVVLTDGQTPWDEHTAEPPQTTWVIISREPVYVPRRLRSVVRVYVGAAG